MTVPIKPHQHAADNTFPASCHLVHPLLLPLYSSDRCWAPHWCLFHTTPEEHRRSSRLIRCQHITGGWLHPGVLPLTDPVGKAGAVFMCFDSRLSNKKQIQFWLNTLCFLTSQLTRLWLRWSVCVCVCDRQRGFGVNARRMCVTDLWLWLQVNPVF